jgi:hypothetical protein
MIDGSSRRGSWGVVANGCLHLAFFCMDFNKKKQFQTMECARVHNRAAGV